MSAGVSIDNVSFGYGAGLVLDDVSLKVEKGEFFAFLGPSGSGKTTLLRLIAGFGMPGAGTIRVGDQDVTRLPPWRRPVGLVFQNYALWPHMTVAGNVAFGLEQRKLARSAIKAKVRQALDLVGLGALADRRPAQLSGGQQQRVALARTLAVEPAVLLLDEPLSNLDAKLRGEVRAELRALQRRLGLTAIFVTHDQEEANAIADRMAVLDGGRIQQVGAPPELYDRPANRFVAGFLGASNMIEGRVEGGRFGAAGIAIAAPGAGDGACCLMVRPQDVTLDAGDIMGEIHGREFLGNTVRYEVAIGAARLAVDETHRRGAILRAVGARVAVAIDPARATFLR